MQNKKLILPYLVLFLMLLSVLEITIYAKSNSPPHWDKNWSYKQEIIIPIQTDDEFSIYQPIDMQIEFNNPCWAIDETHHSVRICCWDGDNWHELESQIYNLDRINPSYIRKCGIVFLIPNFANGKEKYYIYYDNDETQSPDYLDHLDIEDAYYFFEPISGIAAEGDYYKIIEDGYIVYGVGQKGKAIYRPLSQTVVKQKPDTKEFGLKSSDNIASFCFSYHKGIEDEDEISSDNSLISKGIINDGNLMIEFSIISQSDDNNLRSNNIYKYYYCPTDTKRISVHVKHEIFEDVEVEGIINVDGRYGAIITYSSKSERIEQMRFGEILPYIHIYDENNRIKEYSMDSNPEGQERDWIIPYTHDCDLGSKSWISYDEGSKGKAHAIIFSSNRDIIKTGEKERDGIQVKVAEREFLNMLGAEIDYAAINFGRNSYEHGGEHDLKIPGGLVVEYDAEFYTTENGGYKDVISESNYFRSLVEYRHNEIEDPSEGDQHIHTLKVIPRLTGRFLSNPIFANLTGTCITEIYAELYKDGNLITTSKTVKPILSPPEIHFPKLSKGNYSIKVFRKIGKYITNYIGFEHIYLDKDIEVDIYCTWEKNIDIRILNQKNEYIEDIELILYKNDTIITQNITNGKDKTVFTVPFNHIDPYILKAKYKGFLLYNKEIKRLQTLLTINQELYDLKVDFRDKLGFPPGINIRPILYSHEMDERYHIIPDESEYGRYSFNNLIEGTYELFISHGIFSDVIKIKVPDDGNRIKAYFLAEYKIKTELLDSRGNKIDQKDKIVRYYRDNKLVYEIDNLDEKVLLPPGDYTVKVVYDNTIIGIKNVDLTNDKNINIVTTIESSIPLIFTILVIIFIIEIIIILLLKRISLNTFLKLLAISLIILSLFQPWWTLSANSNASSVTKNTELFILPQTMIERIEYNDELYIDIALIPEIFTDFLGMLLLIIFVGIILIGISFILNIFLKRRFAFILILASVIFLILVSIAFTYGMSKITELTLGSLQGSGTLEVELPDGQISYMPGTWGMGLGFYLCIFSAIILISGGIIDSLRTKKIPSQLFKKKTK